MFNGNYKEETQVYKVLVGVEGFWYVYDSHSECPKGHLESSKSYLEPL